MLNSLKDENSVFGANVLEIEGTKIKAPHIQYLVRKFLKKLDQNSLVVMKQQIEKLKEVLEVLSKSEEELREEMTELGEEMTELDILKHVYDKQELEKDENRIALLMLILIRYISQRKIRAEKTMNFLRQALAQKRYHSQDQYDSEKLKNKIFECLKQCVEPLKEISGEATEIELEATDIEAKTIESETGITQRKTNIKSWYFIKGPKGGYSEYKRFKGQLLTTVPAASETII